MRVVGQLCSLKYKWFQFIIAPFLLYLFLPWEGRASALLCQDLGIPLLLISFDPCSPGGPCCLVWKGRGTASGWAVCPSELLFHFLIIPSFSRKTPASLGHQQRTLSVSPWDAGRCPGCVGPHPTAICCQVCQG